MATTELLLVLASADVDIASFGRYGRALANLPPARHPWSPLDVGDALHGLQAAGLHIHAT